MAIARASSLPVVSVGSNGPSAEDILNKLRDAGLRVVRFGETLVNGTDQQCTTQ
jgi:hypothetical protein